MFSFFNAHARLGETKKELDLRYGKSSRETSGKANEKSVFYLDGWYILYFRLINDKAEVMIVTKKNPEEINQKDVDVFLGKNSTRGGFIKISEDGDFIYFKEEGSSRSARWSYRPESSWGTQLLLYTKEGEELMESDVNEHTKKY
jgi:hypothetical protein